MMDVAPARRWLGPTSRAWRFRPFVLRATGEHDTYWQKAIWPEDQTIGISSRPAQLMDSGEGQGP